MTMPRDEVGIDRPLPRLRLVPIYWLLTMSLKTNEEISRRFTLWPQRLTLETTRPSSPTRPGTRATSTRSTYVCMNTVLSIALALPAAYAFSRYRFLGDKHLFFWLLTNRMAPPAVFRCPSSTSTRRIGLFDTPWAVALATLPLQRAAGRVDPRGLHVRRAPELDETAYIDGYSFPRFFLRIFLPLIRSGIGVTAFFCFMFSWVELLLARTLTSVDAKPIAATMTRTVQRGGHGLGPPRGGRRAHVVPGAIVIWFVRNYIAKGFALGRV